MRECAEDNACAEVRRMVAHVEMYVAEDADIGGNGVDGGMKGHKSGSVVRLRDDSVSGAVMLYVYCACLQLEVILHERVVNGLSVSK